VGFSASLPWDIVVVGVRRLLAVSSSSGLCCELVVVGFSVRRCSSLRRWALASVVGLYVVVPSSFTTQGGVAHTSGVPTHGVVRVAARYAGVCCHRRRSRRCSLRRRGLSS